MWNKYLIIGLVSLLSCQWAAAGVLPKDSAELYEVAFWNSVKDSPHPEDYEHYLRAYPQGRFASLARGRIGRLKAGAPPPVAVGPAAPPMQAAPSAAKPPRKKPRPAPAAIARAAPAAEPALESPVTVIAPTPAKPLPPPPDIKELQDCPACPTLVQLPGGVFTMGSDSGDTTEKPSHSVALGRVFAIGKDEVTVEQWEACADAGACAPLTDDITAPDTAPVRNVNWDDAQRYVQWLRWRTGKAYRLPTEAEWEYAARGGPADVGPFAVNPFGFEGMANGVWEWVSDCWHDSYLGAPPDGNSWEEESTCQMRVVRGGEWRRGVPYIKPSTRWRYFSSARDPRNGFRVARDVE